MSNETKRLSLLVTQWYDRTQVLEQRIAKAKAILQSDEYADHDPEGEIQRALNALEGK